MDRESNNDSKYCVVCRDVAESHVVGLYCIPTISDMF